jgi:hypothetical protein
MIKEYDMETEALNMIKEYDMETEALKLCGYAKKVVENLSLDGHDISVMDLLDTLAQDGLTLQVSEENLASITYFQLGMFNIFKDKSLCLIDLSEA